MLRSKITRKGQITIPVEIRRELGLQEGDHVEFVRENGHIELVVGNLDKPPIDYSWLPEGSVARQTAGIGWKYARKFAHIPIEERMRQEKEAVAQAIIDDWLETEKRMR